MYGSAGFWGALFPPLTCQCFCDAPKSARYARSITTLRLRPCAATPTYRRAFFSLDGTVLAKNESLRFGPGGGNTSTPERPNSAWICRAACRTVAVEATIFGRVLLS